VTLNISAGQTTPDSGGPGAGSASAGAGEPAADTPERRALNAEVIAELSSWNPREFIGAFRRWHHGSLSLIHLNVLTLLEVEGPLSMSKLAEGLDVSVASATGIVDRMEQRGLVERQHDLADRRVVVVHGTPAGAKVFEDIDDHRRTGLAKLLSRLTDAELSGLLAGHRALRAARAAAVAERDATDLKSATDAGPATNEAQP
jgi:DNA-binding MarR family transcriptional regulator